RRPPARRAGFAHESGARPRASLSVSPAAPAKTASPPGAGGPVARVRLDASSPHVFMADGDAPAGTSCQPQVNPIRTGQGTSPGACMHDGDPAHVYVGDGTYVSSWNVLGAGVAVGF